MSSVADYLIIGGGIVGLATALAVSERFPGAAILILEKEKELAFHQTGHNSGVIHSGVYYKPDSFKARFTRAGNRRLVEFCQAHDIAHEICGKVIVATQEKELPQLEILYQRGLANGVPAERLTAEQVQEREPEVRCFGGIYVPTAGIVDYRQVCRKYAELVRERGGEIRLGQTVIKIKNSAVGCRLTTEKEHFETRFLINCGGLQSDRLAKLAGCAPEAKIVPFRGEYYEIKPEKRHLVKSLIYPVPNPDFPFLGVHFTRMIDGSVHAGPNAVLSFKREGYGKWDFDWRDFSDAVAYPGFWKLAGKHWDEGLKEIWRSLSQRAFVQSLQQLIPAVSAEDIIPTPPGIRAQALRPDGALVEDFLILEGPATLQVCNAPSPAATASLEIGRAIAERIP